MPPSFQCVNITDSSSAGKFVAFVGADDYRHQDWSSALSTEDAERRGQLSHSRRRQGRADHTDRVRGCNNALKESPAPRYGVAAGELSAATGAPGDRRPAAVRPANRWRARGERCDGDGRGRGLEGVIAAPRSLASTGPRTRNRRHQGRKALASGDADGFLQGCIGTLIAARTLPKQPVVSEWWWSAVVSKENCQPAAHRSVPHMSDLGTGSDDGQIDGSSRKTRRPGLSDPASKQEITMLFIIHAVDRTDALATRLETTTPTRPSFGYQPFRREDRHVGSARC